MALFDFLSGSDEAATAAAQNRAALAGYQGTAIGNLADYGIQARGDITAGTQAATGAVNAATGQAAGAYGNAVNAYNPLANLGSQYGGAVNAYYDALGLNGPAGSANALANFQGSPGYQYLQDEAARQVTNQASRYGASGGNTLTALQDRATQLANQNWTQNYLNPLAAFPGLAASTTGAAAAGQAGAYGQLGGLYSGAGNTLAGLYTGQGSDLANIGGNVVQGQLGVGRDVTTGNIAANNLVAQAGMQDAANTWNAIGGLGTGVARAAFPTSGVGGLYGTTARA